MLSEKFEAAKAAAKEWQHRIKTDKSRKYGSKERAKAQIKSYFKDIDWDAWQFKLQLDDGIFTDADGKLKIQLDGPREAKGRAVWIEYIRDWESEIAAYGFFGNKVSDILTEDMQKIYENWDAIGEYVRKHLERRLHVEAAKSIPLPSRNPIVTPEPPPEPTQQEPPKIIGDSGTSTQAQAQMPEPAPPPSPKNSGRRHTGKQE